MVISNRELLHQITDTVIRWMELHINERWSFSVHVHHYRELQKDSILRAATHLIIAYAPDSLKCARENTLLSLSYAELYATSLGLGTCFAGLVEFCGFPGFSPFLDLLLIPKNHHMTGALMVGYPKVYYKNLVERSPLNVSFL